MPIYTIAQYQVRPSGTEKVKRAIEEFVPYVKANEPGTRMYLAWQQQEDPTRFVHFFIFADDAAHHAHSQSAAVKQFESAYRPELISEGVTFTDYHSIAANRGHTADIRHSIQIAAKPEAVYPLVATGEGFKQWWAADVTEAGGAVELGFFNRSTVHRLRLAESRPPLHAEWVCETGNEWSGTRIGFRLEARGAETQLHFTHAGWRSESDYFINCTTTWGELMYRLKAAAEGKPKGPLFLLGGLAY
jgi:quinol monooxygenase YgiN/uncharacterized protein YndB with AHSA1/START domain